MTDITPQTSPKLVKKIAELSDITLENETELHSITQALTDTLKMFENLEKLDLEDIEPLHQVTGLETVLRDDKVVKEYMFTQSQALKNAQRTYQGYFVVPRVIDREA